MKKQSWMRLLALLLAFAMIAAACGGDDDDDPVADGDDASEPAEEPADEPEEPADEPAGDFPEGPELSLGTLLPETGPLAVLGAGMVPSVQLAVAI